MTYSNDREGFASSRLSLQAVAEHVLSAALHTATGRIGLRPSPNGFSTPAFPHQGGERRIAVDGVEIVVIDDGREQRSPLTTLRATTALTGVEPGAPTSVYTPSTPLDLDAPLAIDPAHATAIAAWYALVAEALEALRAERPGEEPSIVQLWPEHFDLACTISEVNYGGSPGDGGHDLPYLYVGPFAPPPADGDYWNEPFGASRSRDQIARVEDALAFFREGEARVAEA
jgi:hypothetical protein